MEYKPFYYLNGTIYRKIHEQKLLLKISFSICEIEPFRQAATDRCERYVSNQDCGKLLKSYIPTGV